MSDSAMADPVARLNAALSGRYTIERELGEGGMATFAGRVAPYGRPNWTELP